MSFGTRTDEGGRFYTAGSRVIETCLCVSLRRGEVNHLGVIKIFLPNARLSAHLWARLAEGGFVGMTDTGALHWLVEDDQWKHKLKALTSSGTPTWNDLQRLANCRLDFTRTNMLDTILKRAFVEPPPQAPAGKPVRLAILGSSTFSHLHAGIRVAALRRGIHVTIHENEYGQYLQEILDRKSALHQFAPNLVLFALDARHVTMGLHGGMTLTESDRALSGVLEQIETCWQMARESFSCPLLQQTIMPVLAPIMGNNEHRASGSAADFIRRLNAELRGRSNSAGVNLLALDARIQQDGLLAWHDLGQWYRAKQEVCPAAGPMYGELVARIIAAMQGLTSKCLVLDLDNTLWGGVIGDDGLEGIALGQGSALGEAFLGVQTYAKELAQRGIILAVCSKNNDANAQEPFEKHPEMVLRRTDIACFVANWADKAGNLRSIARALNIGLDSLVFLDDNPAERGLVRRELPMVAVPEVSDDPTSYVRALVDAGYFESVRITDEDKIRSEQYQGNLLREADKAAKTDMASYLRSLNMKLIWRPFDEIGLSRITQLINKSNQFNLTTRRYTEEEIAAMIGDPAAMGLQLRLLDRYGDNGVIAVIIGRQDGATLDIDTWLMSCRVLGRQVEKATLNIIVEEAKRRGALHVTGRYIPTAKNGMVIDHYRNLGFASLPVAPGDGDRYVLEIASFRPRETAICILAG